MDSGSQPSDERTPLLDQHETPLGRHLRLLDTFLRFFGFHQSAPLSCFLSWVVFFCVGIFVPAFALKATDCSIYQKLHVIRFEIFILASQSALVAVSLLCISHNLRKYGIERFLFVDRYHGQTTRFHTAYVEKIRGFFFMLLFWILPCFLVKTIREIFRIVYTHNESSWASIGISVALIVSWIYLTTIFLSACSLFNLACNLRVIHFEDYGEILERESNAVTLLEEHLWLRYQLSKISHRFRMYLLLVLSVVTASQLVTLFQTTGYNGAINFINAGDCVVASVVQVVGIILCFHAAAKISHRAQSIGSFPSMWPDSSTCNSPDASPQNATVTANEEPFSLKLPTHLGEHLVSYHKRQALTLYLRSNPGGITIFGWTVDRSLLNTIFFTQLSLVLWVLGKTIVFPSKVLTMNYNSSHSWWKPIQNNAVSL